MSQSDVPPQVEIREFTNLKSLFQYIDEEIARFRAELGELLRRLEEAKAKAEMMEKLERIVKELAGQESIGGATIDLGGVLVYVNPTPKQEFDIFVEAIRNMQDRIVHLERIKKNIEPLTKMGDIEFKMEVILRNGVPHAIVLKM
ncbi:MAG: hypothetical protein GSR85_09375 [Desulfurococcales archaeon]|nr:hypothetical protein [Desulfurococcales archaeon]